MTEKPRRCVVCHCTELLACDGGCAWVGNLVDVCDRCVEPLLLALRGFAESAGDTISDEEAVAGIRSLLAETTGDGTPRRLLWTPDGWPGG